MRLRTFTALAALLLLLAGCGSDDGTATTTAAGAGDETTTTTAGDAATSGVHAGDTDLGAILVDPEGFSLYVFTADVGGESTCYDACAETWPAVPGSTAIGPDLDATMFGVTTRTDGSEQLTVNGQPLYRFAPDAAPGDTGGQGLNGVWFVVDVDGAMIEAAGLPTGGYGSTGD